MPPLAVDPIPGTGLITTFTGDPYVAGIFDLSVDSDVNAEVWEDGVMRQALGAVSCVAGSAEIDSTYTPSPGAHYTMKLWVSGFPEHLTPDTEYTP